MKPESKVFQGKIKDQEVIVRYPTMDDVEVMQEFVNAASAERTYIRLQGETFSFEEEAHYLDDVLIKIKEKKVIKLLVFAGNELIAVGDVRREGPASTQHLGRLGIIVKKTARGKGIGRKLMELLIAETKTQLTEVETIILSVYQQNEVARKLYESLGFIEYGRLPNGRKREGGYDNEIEMYLSV